MIASSTYHSLLRVASAVVALVLIFEGGLLSEMTAQLADDTELYLANAVGVTVGVAPNDFNRITAALTAKEQELTNRELTLEQREIAVGIASGGGQSPDRTTFILATILFILLILIILNYALDYIRSREDQTRLMLS